MKIDLLYGRKGLTVDLGEAVGVHLIRKHPLPLLPDPAGAVRRALEKPVGCPSLQELAQGKRNACIRSHGDAEIAVVPEGPYVIPLFGLEPNQAF